MFCTGHLGLGVFRHNVQEEGEADNCSRCRRDSDKYGAPLTLTLCDSNCSRALCHDCCDTLRLDNTGAFFCCDLHEYQGRIGKAGDHAARVAGRLMGRFRSGRPVQKLDMDKVPPPLRQCLSQLGYSEDGSLILPPDEEFIQNGKGQTEEGKGISE